MSNSNSYLGRARRAINALVGVLTEARMSVVVWKREGSYTAPLLLSLSVETYDKRHYA